MAQNQQSSAVAPVKGRFAPSPTGRMHLGNVFSALLSYLSVKSRDGVWLLRVEDLDRGRSRLEYALQVEDDLRWLGLDWDEGGTQGRGSSGPYLQSLRNDVYQQHFERLAAQGLIYPCSCTRADILASQAPHERDGRVVYPGTCRPQRLGGNFPDNGSIVTDAVQDTHAPERTPAQRLFVPSREISFVDGHYGRVSVNLADECGDFIVRRSDGGWAYQLAVVADDAQMGVSEVVRGRDLLLSSPQQIYLYRLLGYSEPSFCHLPLLCSEDGARLCKRDRSLDMGELRKHVSAERIIGHLAFLAGLTQRDEAVSVSELVDDFSWDKVPLDDIVISSGRT